MITIKHVIFVTYDNDRTYARFAQTDEGANAEVTKLKTDPEATKIIKEPYLGRTYFPQVV